VSYTDNTIVAGKNLAIIDQAISDIWKKLVITSSLTVDNFLGVHIQFEGDQISFTQPQLIKSIVKDLGLDMKLNHVCTPTVSNAVIDSHNGSPPHNESWSY
jgi:hypothetical protein